MKYKPEHGFPYYFEYVKHKDLRLAFSSLSTVTLFNSINEEMATFRYAPDKWSIKQIIGHLTDHERIKMFRALLLSRGETIQLWGYNQELLVDNSRFDDLTILQLVTDFVNVRSASISFIDTLSENQLKMKGLAQQHEIALEDFLKSIIGHETHHIHIIEEKYLQTHFRN